MKTLLNVVLVLLVLSLASVCHAQAVLGGGGMQGVYSNTYTMPDHASHASQHSMASETSLLEGSGSSSAHGERPLWEFGSDKVERPLGDVAREYRNEHAQMPKATVVLEKQK